MLCSRSSPRCRGVMGNATAGNIEKGRKHFTPLQPFAESPAAGFPLDASRSRGHWARMHDKWISGFVALVVFGSTACQKEEAPAPSASTQTVTQSAKPVETPAGTTAAPTQPAASTPSSASAASASTVELKV